MATMTISLPEKMKEWVEHQLESGDFASSSDYVRDLIRRDRDRREHERDKARRLAELRAMVDEGWEGAFTKLDTEQIFQKAVEIAKARGTYRA
ncbi:type II toxin-antitoxin system ParD family antitoxin [Aliihoeflea sp. PC F10.4]